MKLPFTIPEWREYPIQEKLLEEIGKHKYHICDAFAVDPRRVKRMEILNAYKGKDGIRVYYRVWYDLARVAFESIGWLHYEEKEE